jgi:hypothetical protein
MNGLKTLLFGEDLTTCVCQNHRYDENCSRKDQWLPFPKGYKYLLATKFRQLSEFSMDISEAPSGYNKV